VKEALLYEKLKDKKVQCQNCAHYCLIELNKRGICKVRENIEGKLYALNYGKLIACNIDPIEKKPFFHFLPNTYSLSVATVGCNFKCKNCQNYQISQEFEKEIEGKKVSPEEIVQLALRNNLPSISYTYTEPTIFLEYALETMKIAKKEGLKNVWVSNGYLSGKVFELIIPYLDAINIDLKSFSDEFYRKNCQARLEPVLKTAKLMKERGVWVEITTLIIPSLSDDKKTFTDIAQFIKKELGEETPWHLTGFSGKLSWKLKNVLDTSSEKIQLALKIGKKIGLKNIYV